MDNDIEVRPTTKLDYRPDIDGLRAIAVVAVVFYHFQIAGFSGGFVGVDIFFVISGYLITGIIQKDLMRGNFSFIAFYDRRIRRILPALTSVVITTFVVGYFILLPNDLELLGQNVAYTAVFASNIFFWQHSGYFSPEAHELPLLHTWSLAVEEQFYIFWPIVLVLLSHYRFRLLTAIIVIVVFSISLSLGEWLIDQNSYAAGFYLTPIRVWELMMGAILALGLFPKINNRYAAECLGLLGIGLIIYPIFIFSSKTPFPGVNAIAPCLGTVLTIYSGNNYKTLITHGLSIRPVVFVGLISYSLYLWHWPIIAYSNYYLIFRGLTLVEVVFLIGLSFTLAILSWKFIEQPFRYSNKKKSSKKVVVYGGLGVTTVTFCIGLVIYGLNGFPDRLPTASLSALSVTEWLHPKADDCLLNVTDTQLIDGCLIGSRSDNTSYQVVLWGDSHAAHYMPLIEAAGNKGGWQARQMSMRECAPFLGENTRSSRYINCHGFNKKVLEEILTNEDVKLVVLAARWAVYNDNLESIKKTIEVLLKGGKKLLIFGQVPQADFSPVKCLAMARWSGWLENRCNISTKGSTYKLQVKQNNFFHRLTESTQDVKVFLPMDDLCDDNYCYTSTGDISMYFDNNHIHTSAALLVAEFIDDSVWSPVYKAKP